ncbi:DoxX family protein [Aminobacter sp. BA135]|uniref:DoxX family protein n=1 Tax=Aminobacter sp. BA135 TaxID=537596 RepID=UPI003D79FD2E
MATMAASLGFILLGGVFVWAGTEHFWNFRKVSGYLTDRGLPVAAVLLALGAIVEIVAGLCLAFGVMRPYAATALILFTIAASLMALDFWRYSGAERQGMRSAFIINFAVVGGLLLAATA